MSKHEARVPKVKNAQERARQAAMNDEAALDEALEQTFPASDPIAVHSEHDDDLRKPAKH